MTKCKGDRIIIIFIGIPTDIGYQKVRMLMTNEGRSSRFRLSNMKELILRPMDDQ